MLASGAGFLLDAAARVWAGAAALANPVTIALAEPVPKSAAEVRLDLDDLVAAYPDALAGHDGTVLRWRDGTTMAVGEDPRRSAAQVLDAPQVRDIFAWPYTLGPLAKAPRPLGDPGRARPGAFFMKLYGDCRKGEVQPKLVETPWPGGHKVRFTSAHGAARALTEVSLELSALGPRYQKYFWPLSGTFECRTIAGQKDLSMHSYGAAIDLGSRHGGYWRWGPTNPGSSLPQEVVDAFERHGFIWGAKWAHFDSFHFEYRPELIRAARRRAG